MAAEGRIVGTQPSAFGRQVRALRLASGWTQADLAERSGLSERTVSDLERGLRATAYPSTARQLAAALQVGPTALEAFLADARGSPEAQEPAAAAPTADRRATLPRPLTRLIGRASEVATVVGSMSDPATRLITLIGIGGIGKTRLALEIASQAHPVFPGGSFFVELSALDDPAMVLPAIATALGLPAALEDLPVALSRIRGARRVLLVLDTLEHLLASAPALAALLEANEQLCVLATSRTPLHVRGEQEVPVLPLPVPENEAGFASPAVELFVERATAVRPGLDRGPAALAIVADICARLDGVPLAIELAAARVKHLSLAELRRHLEHRLEPLGEGARDLPERQRTMRSTHDWSYALLGPAEMRLFRSLAVFRGGFTGDAAEAVLDPSSSGATSVLEPLGVLVDSSLVFRMPTGSEQSRYRLLDVTREYAVERSVAAGEFDAARRRHLEHFLAYAEAAEPELRGHDQQRWQARLLADEGNFRAALTWALESGEHEAALRLAGALWMFWRQAALFAEGRAWLDAALAAAGAQCPVEVRCRGLWGAGWLAFHAGAYERTAERGEEMLRLIAERADDLDRRNGLTLIGTAALAVGRDADAIAAYERALAICATMGTGWHLATSKLNLGTAKRQAGALAEATVVLTEALATYEDLGDRHFTARVLVQLGFIALLEGRHEDAGHLLERAMGIFAELGNGWAIAEGLEAIATLRSDRDPERAALLGGAAERLRERIAALPHPSDARITAACLERARVRLSAPAFDAAWGKGRQLPPPEAVSLALKTVATDRSPAG
ncbi:MAG: hypothetical protein NVS1B1_02590 [Candidatus Limnocylindrales bacterium]